MKFTVAKAQSDHPAATLVVFAYQDKTKGESKLKKSKHKDAPAPRATGANAELNAVLADLAKEKLFAGSSQQVYFLRNANLSNAHNVLLIGLGSRDEITAESVRQAAACAFATLKAQNVKVATVAASSVCEFVKHGEELAQALVEGFELASYSSKLYVSKTDGEELPERIEFRFAGAALEGFDRGIKSGQILSECVNFSRTLGDRPGNRMTPTILAEETRKAARGSTLKVTIWGRERIAREKMGSFLSVSLGSDQEPKFIVMEYKGAGKSAPVCFVGKGLTFDSGGISIKPSQGMEEMKYDMCGGANVIGTMLAIARLKLKVNAIGFVPATENMPGPSANKPGDIVSARNGKTIEVNNTDAEGRLILADALVYASEQKPAFIVDAATLTGAMVVALGNFHTGYFCSDSELVERIEKAAERSGEAIWHMPVTPGHLKDMKGTFADLSNISSGKGAGSGTAAAFLSEFVDSEIPYAHFDVAGTAWHLGGRLSYCPKKGASGVMIRTFVELARDFE